MTLAAALAHHQAGRLDEAAQIYRRVVAAEPDNADALYLFGILSRQLHRPETAIELIGRAIALRPGVPQFHNELGAALLDAGGVEEAKRAFMRAVYLLPRYCEALLNLANILKSGGNEQDADTCYRAVVKLQPAHEASAA
jgi:protein O-GlcNAc transferase